VCFLLLLLLNFPFVWERGSFYYLKGFLMVCLLQNLREGFDDGNVNAEDSSKFTNYENLKNWKEEKLIQSIRDRFVTGDWQKAKSGSEIPEADTEDDDAVYGDLEDLEAEENERHPTDDIGNGAIQKEDDSAAEERRLKKLALRAKFDAQYPFNIIHFH
jgi:ribosome biogenesis protein BMS1